MASLGIIYTEDVERDVLFNDGEGLTFGDLNDAQRIASRKNHHQGLAFHNASPTGLSAVRPIDNALRIELTSGMTFDLYGGNVYDKTTASIVEFGDGLDTLTTFAPDDGTGIAGGEARIDILSVKITEVDGDSQTRHLKDGVTGALSTTPPQDKRRFFRVDVEHVEGTAGVSPTPPATPGGALKIHEIYVASGDTTVPTYQYADFREPAGATAHYVPATVFMNHPSSTWAYDFAWTSAVSVFGELTAAVLPTSRRNPSLEHAADLRFQSVGWFGSITVGDVQLRKGRVSLNLPVAISDYLGGVLAGTQLVVNTSSTDQHRLETYGGALPVWASAATRPLGFGAGDPGVLMVTFKSDSPPTFTSRVGSAIVVNFLGIP